MYGANYARFMEYVDGIIDRVHDERALLTERQVDELKATVRETYRDELKGWREEIMKGIEVRLHEHKVKDKDDAFEMKLVCPATEQNNGTLFGFRRRDLILFDPNGELFDVNKDPEDELFEEGDGSENKEGEEEGEEEVED